jgi:hypothetical protein
MMMSKRSEGWKILFWVGYACWKGMNAGKRENVREENEVKIIKRGIKSVLGSRATRSSLSCCLIHYRYFV